MLTTMSLVIREEADCGPNDTNNLGLRASAAQILRLIS